MLLTYPSLNSHSFLVDPNHLLKPFSRRYFIWCLNCTGKLNNLDYEVYVSIYLRLRPDDTKELPPDLAPHGAGVDDNSMAVFFEIFWSFSFSFSRDRNLTLSVLQVYPVTAIVAPVRPQVRIDPSIWWILIPPLPLILAWCFITTVFVLRCRKCPPQLKTSGNPLWFSPSFLVRSFFGVTLTNLISGSFSPAHEDYHTTIWYTR